MLSGYCILVLLLFRISWGFLGSYHSRFRNFLTLKGLIPYARQILKKSGNANGHNPLGAWSVIAMLAVIMVQAATGLFSDDDIMTKGPLSHLVSDNIVNDLTTMHRLNAWFIYGLVGLHLIAIIFYEVYHRNRLVLPMITGQQKFADDQITTKDRPEEYSRVRAIFLIFTFSGLIYFLVN